MPPLSKKVEILDVLRQVYSVEHVAGQSLFRVGCEATIYVRYSKDLGGRRFFFGVGERDFRTYCSSNLFVVLVCGRPDSTVVIPAETLGTLLGVAKVAHGQWKLNVIIKDDRFLMRVPAAGVYDVSEFANWFDFSPPSSRGDLGPKVRDFTPLTRPREVHVGPPSPLEPLDISLLKSARDSENPKRFEHALVDSFAALGLKCRPIGGPGETDVLIEEPRTIVVDGKTTKAPKLGQINFTRIKGHRDAHRAEAMLIVAPGFQPAVVRDAEREGAGLIEVATLSAILRAHEEIPIAADHLTLAFRLSGLIEERHFVAAQEELRSAVMWMEGACLVLDHLDFAPRSLDELKGRLDLSQEKKGKEGLPKDVLQGLLDCLTQQPFRVVERQDAGYRLRYARALAGKRIAGIVSMAERRSEA